MVVFCSKSGSFPCDGFCPLIPAQYPELVVQETAGLTPMKTGFAVVPRECISP